MAQVSEVLLASDFSARSDRPLDRAIQLAGQWGAHLAIAHVLEKGGQQKGDGAISGQIIERLRADLPEAARNAELIIESGSAPKVLAKIAAERHSDLIVTGVARYNSLGDYMLGTAVDHIIRNAGMPVLVVKRRALAPYRRVLVATDLSGCSRVALLKALELFPEAEITLLHSYHVPFEGLHKSDDIKTYVRDEARLGLDGFLTHEDILPSHRKRIVDLIEEGETGSVVARVLRQQNIDLLVLGTHGRSGFFHATIGSQAEALLEIANADVLMVREAKS
jgi:nucleotide-binding universal stress UspA family protein